MNRYLRLLPRFGLLLGVLQWLLAVPVLAQPELGDCLLHPLMPGYQIVRILPLTHGMTHAQSETHGRFLNVTRSVTLEQGDRVLLAGSAGGRDPFQVDDFLWVVTDSGQGWAHNFRMAPNQTALVNLKPQDVTHLFTHTGQNQVSLLLKNRTERSFASSPLWLVVFRPCATLATSHAPLAATPTMQATLAASAPVARATPTAAMPKTMENQRFGIRPVLVVLLIGLGISAGLVLSRWSATHAAPQSPEEEPLHSPDRMQDQDADDLSALPVAAEVRQEEAAEAVIPAAPKVRRPKRSKAMA